jgi:hypothetical protein
LATSLAQKGVSEAKLLEACHLFPKRFMSSFLDYDTALTILLPKQLNSPVDGLVYGPCFWFLDTIGEMQDRIYTVNLADSKALGRKVEVSLSLVLDLKWQDFEKLRKEGKKNVIKSREFFKFSVCLH